MMFNEVKFCTDTLLIETILAEPKMYKKAGLVSDLLSSVGEYFSSKIDKNSPVESVLNLIAPGAVMFLFRSLGMGKIGLLAGLLMSVFHVDVMGLLRSIFGKVRGLVGGGQKVNSSQIDDAVRESVQDFSKPADTTEAQEGFQQLQSEQQADDGRVYSSVDLLGDAKMLNLAMIAYEAENMRLLKESAPKPDWNKFLSGYSGTKAKGTSLIGTVFGWIIKLAFASAGLMVAGDIVNKFLGRPNSLDHTYQAGKEEPVQQAAPMSTQTKFKPKSNAPLPDTWPLVNTPTNVENMLIQFTKDVYDGLDGKESLIQSSPAFQAVKEEIDWYNAHNPGSAAIFLPKVFTSKKQLVDTFIDDVAKRAP